MPESRSQAELADLPYAALASSVLGELTDQRCVSITGLSNTGKSTLMRALAGPQVGAAYEAQRGRSVSLFYVDCNRAVASSAQAFYEVVLRSILELLSEAGDSPMAETVGRYHQEITQTNQPFGASLVFNLSLTELCERLGSDVCLLIDEFDELYAELDERALLNLRALHDRFRDRLNYIVATARRLTYMRQREVEGEFAELFSHSTYTMPALTEAEAESLLVRLESGRLSKRIHALSYAHSGGHLGLLLASARYLRAYQGELDQITPEDLVRQPQTGAECLKIWSQLTEEEQASLTSLVIEPDTGLAAPQLRRLEHLGLVRQGSVFSPVFARYILQRSQRPETKEVGIYVDHDSGDVYVDGVRIPVLTDLEFRLMELLEGRKDKLTDKYRIVRDVWGEEYIEEVDDARVEKLVSRLRGKIEADPANPRYLITRRGRGYKLLSKPRHD